jgi:2-dehydro-3-deoxyphosphooctonate aldolase (KDO 8-P synthase)
LGTGSGGNRDFVPGLARAASAMGVSNFFLEVHPDPDTSGSDGPSMIYLDKFDEIIEQIMEYHYDRRKSLG